MGNACKGFRQCAGRCQRNTTVNLNSNCCNHNEDVDPSSRSLRRIDVMLPIIMKEIEQRKDAEQSDSEARLRLELIKAISDEMESIRKDMNQRLEIDMQKVSNQLRYELREKLKQLVVN
jgi:hypothetical protein